MKRGMMENLYLQKISFEGIKGFEKKISFDLSPTKNREFIDNVEFWGLDREKYEFGALKSIVILGENNTGKSSFMDAAFTMFLFLKNPTTYNINYFNDMKNIHSQFMKFEAEFVTKIQDKIVKFYSKITLNPANKEIVDEVLDYKFTVDGRMVSNLKNLYHVKNNRLISMFGVDISLSQFPIFTYGQNGLVSIKMNMYNTVIDQKLNNVSDEERNLISSFFEGLSAHINREVSLGNGGKISIPFIQNNKKKNDLMMSIMRLFDENIKGIHISPNNEVLLEYKFGSKFLIRPLIELIQNRWLSAGATIAFEMISPILVSLEQKNTKVFFDEFGRNLHSTLSNFLIALITLKSQGQTFFTTHDAALTNIAFRKDQIYILKYEKSKEFLEIFRGSDIAPSKNTKFNNVFLNEEFLSSPKKEVREKIWDLIDEM